MTSHCSRSSYSGRGGRGGKKKPGGRGASVRTRSGGQPPSGVFLDRLGKRGRGKGRGLGKGGAVSLGSTRGRRPRFLSCFFMNLILCFAKLKKKINRIWIRICGDFVKRLFSLIFRLFHIYEACNVAFCFCDFRKKFNFLGIVQGCWILIDIIEKRHLCRLSCNAWHRET